VARFALPGSSRAGRTRRYVDAAWGPLDGDVQFIVGSEVVFVGVRVCFRCGRRMPPTDWEAAAAPQSAWRQNGGRNRMFGMRLNRHDGPIDDARLLARPSRIGRLIETGAALTR